jgi:hypothetical protein
VSVAGTAQVIGGLEVGVTKGAVWPAARGRHLAISPPPAKLATSRSRQDDTFPPVTKAPHTTVRTEVRFGLAYWSTSTLVPLSLLSWQERISAQEEQVGALLREQEVTS